MQPDIASIHYFLPNPEGFWKMAKSLAKTLFNAKPNPAHIALAELEKMGKLRCIITQNIDSLHQKAGSKNVIEIHGTARTATCLSCGKKFRDVDILKMLDEGLLVPVCDRCGGLIKVDAVFFGENLPRDALSRAMDESIHCDAMLVVGSSLVVYPVAYISSSIGKGARANIIVVNLEPTWFDRIADVVIHGKAGEILPEIVAKVKELLLSDNSNTR